MHPLLQTTPPAQPELVNVADSVKFAAAQIAKEMTEDPSAFAQKAIQEFLSFGFKVLAALAIYIIGAWIIKRIKRTLAAVLERRRTEKTIASFISSLVSILLTLILIILTVSALGVNTTSIAALLGAGAVAIGMAMSGTMENLAGGLIILIFKPFKAGDFIAVQGYSGTVKEVTIVNTKITTTDNRNIIIPNGLLSNGYVDNYSQQPYRRIEWKLGMEYGIDAEACAEALLKIVSADERILDSSVPGAEDPMTALAEMGDSCIYIIARGWVAKDDYWKVLFDLNKAIYRELPEQGFDFAFPHMDVTLKQ